MSNWLVLIVDARNELQVRLTASGKEEDLSKLFDKSGDAERWATRKLVECGSDCVAIVQSTRMMARDGNPLTLKITRDQAMGKMFPKAKGPAVKSTLSKNAPLTFRMTCHQTRVTFSHG
jgi:hypothetical protein